MILEHLGAAQTSTFTFGTKSGTESVTHLNLPRVDPQTRLQHRLSCACFTYSDHFQGILIQFVPSWRPKISQKSPSFVSRIRPKAPMTASACGYHLLHAVKRGPMSTCSSTFTTCHGALPDQFSALGRLPQLFLDTHNPPPPPPPPSQKQAMRPGLAIRHS